MRRRNSASSPSSEYSLSVPRELVFSHLQPTARTPIPRCERHSSIRSACWKNQDDNLRWSPKDHVRSSTWAEERPAYSRVISNIVAFRSAKSGQTLVEGFLTSNSNFSRVPLLFAERKATMFPAFISLSRDGVVRCEMKQRKSGEVRQVLLTSEMWEQPISKPLCFALRAWPGRVFRQRS
jgi:hypothetical protein